MIDLSVIFCSWKRPDLVESCITSLLSSLTVSFEIKVVLNEGDDESCRILDAFGVEYIRLKENLGTSAIDYTIPLITGKYIFNTNDDMLFHEGFDKDLIYNCNKYYPCSCSPTLVHPLYDVNSSAPITHDLGYVTDFTTQKRFSDNVKKGLYNKKSRVGFNHPILVTREDFLAVNGFSDNMDMDWFPGWTLDLDFPYRLWLLHDKKFKFICSGSSFVYHQCSESNNKLDNSVFAPTDWGRSTFFNKRGMTTKQFLNLINYDSIIES